MKKFALLVITLMTAGQIFAQKTTVTSIRRETTYRMSELKVWYQGEVNLGFATGGKVVWDGDIEKTNFDRVFLETVQGVRITKYGFAGLGTGLHYIYGRFDPKYKKSERWNTLLMPIYLNLKGYYPVTDDFAPYASMSFGGSAALASNLNDDFDSSYGSYSVRLRGGFYYQVGVGITYGALNFGFGYTLQKMKCKYFEDGYSESESLKNDSFYIQVGLKF